MQKKIDWIIDATQKIKFGTEIIWIIVRINNKFLSVKLVKFPTINNKNDQTLTNNQKYSTNTNSNNNLSSNLTNCKNCSFCKDCNDCINCPECCKNKLNQNNQTNKSYNEDTLNNTSSIINKNKATSINPLNEKESIETFASFIDKNYRQNQEKFKTTNVNNSGVVVNKYKPIKNTPYTTTSL